MNKYVVPAAMTVVAILFPAASLAESLPLRGGDLANAERYHTFVHIGGGDQTEGKDIGALRRTADGNWTRLTSDGADSKILSNWVVYGKPFYAMAAGKVIGCWRNAPENTPGSLHPDLLAKKFAGGGNHLWILQDDGAIALYAHARPGTIPSSLCPNNAKLFTGLAGQGPKWVIESEVQVANGARVEAGTKLGEIGNSGSSSGGPHLHVHLTPDHKAPKAMTFERGLTTPYSAKASLDGPWTRVAGKPLPNASILVWPARPSGNYTFNGIKGADYQRLVEHLQDSGVMPKLITCTSNGATYNSSWIPATDQWASFHAMSPAKAAEKHAYYTHQGYKRTSVFTCGTATVAVWRK
ncbi:MAG TPA: hypothetical protein VF605_18425 [Allosphingosinicella sp.]